MNSSHPDDDRSAWLRRHVKAVPLLLSAYLCAGLILAGVALANVFLGIPVGDLTRDPANSIGFPPYQGLLSYLGILMWCATATLCIFSSIALWGRQDPQHLGPLLLASGLLSSMLLADDLFLLHEGVFRRSVVYFTYAMALVTILIAFQRTILQTEFLILVTAGAFLALSMLSDRLITERTSLKFFVEDGFKFVGIVGWFTYYARLSWIRVRSAFGEALGATESDRTARAAALASVGAVADAMPVAEGISLTEIGLPAQPRWRTKVTPKTDVDTAK